MWINNSLKLNNAHVQQRKKSLAPHGSVTGFSGSNNNRVIQLKWETVCESVCYRERPETQQNYIKFLGETRNNYVGEKREGLENLLYELEEIFGRNQIIISVEATVIPTWVFNQELTYNERNWNLFAGEQ